MDDKQRIRDLAYMLELYQDEIVPRLRKRIARLEDGRNIGHWVLIQDEDGEPLEYRCSECGASINVYESDPVNWGEYYCFSCGVRMEAAGENK